MSVSFSLSLAPSPNAPSEPEGSLLGLLEVHVCSVLPCFQRFASFVQVLLSILEEVALLLVHLRVLNATDLFELCTVNQEHFAVGFEGVSKFRDETVGDHVLYFFDAASLCAMSRSLRTEGTAPSQIFERSKGSSFLRCASASFFFFFSASLRA